MASRPAITVGPVIDEAPVRAREGGGDPLGVAVVAVAVSVVGVAVVGVESAVVVVVARAVVVVVLSSTGGGGGGGGEPARLALPALRS